MSVRPDHPHLRLPDTPRRQVRCPVCDRYAEPMTEDGICWLDLATARRLPEYRIPHDTVPRRPDPARDKRVEEHAERVARELGEVSS